MCGSEQRLGRTPLRVGLLISWFGEGYSAPLVMGASDLVASRGASIVCVAGGRAAVDPDDRAGSIYKIVGSANVDALVIASGTFMPGLGDSGVSRFASRYRALPVVSIGVRVPGVPSVLVDGARGLGDVLEHLIDVHGHRRIAFVRGPEASTEAADRYQVFRTVLERHGIAIDPELVAPGHFMQPDGAAAADFWLRADRLPEAIVAANDEMAIGALEHLHARGKRVPDDVAIVGFDDTDFAGAMIPSLTTVRQPLYELGRIAAEIALAKLAGEQVPGEVVLQSSAVVRESCGCSARAVLRSADAGPISMRSRSAPRGEVIDAIARASNAPEELVRDWSTRLLDALERDLGDGGSDRFVGELERVLREGARSGGPIWPPQPVLSMLRGWAIGAAGDPATRQHLDDIWDEGRILVGEAGRRAVAYQKLLSDRRASAISSLNQRLINATTLEEVSVLFEEVVGQSDIRSGHICVFDDAREPGGAARLLCRADREHPAQLGPGTSFAATDLLPRHLLPEGPSSMLVQRLSFGGVQRGFLVLEGPLRPGTFPDELRQELSSALLRVEREQELARLHALERERALELERAYGALKENQEKLLIAEKLAALGRLTAGIAHEMNTPLAAARAALQEVSKLSDEYVAAIDDPEITPQDHRLIGGDMRRAILLGQNAATKLAGFVHRMKAQTRDIADRRRERFDAVQVVKDALAASTRAVEQARCRISFEHDQGASWLDGSAESLGEVIANLVTNAVEASVPKGGGPIAIRLRSSSDAVALDVIDEGVGIQPEALGKIFDPFYTTKPFGEATGLGLTVVHDMVARDLDGTIAVESEVGKGTTFSLRFEAVREESAAKS